MQCIQYLYFIGDNSTPAHGSLNVPLCRVYVGAEISVDEQSFLPGEKHFVQFVAAVSIASFQKIVVESTVILVKFLQNRTTYEM